MLEIIIIIGINIIGIGTQETVRYTCFNPIPEGAGWGEAQRKHVVHVLRSAEMDGFTFQESAWPEPVCDLPQQG